MKKLVLALCMAALALSAKAQLSNNHIGKRSIQNLKVSFKYTRHTATDETIVIRDTTYSIDWAQRDITIDGVVYPIDKATCLPTSFVSVVFFDERQLILKYSTDWQRLIGYEFK
jgi:hypothetical protein